MELVETATKADELYRDAIVIDATAPILDRDDEWPKWHTGGVTAAMATLASVEDAATTIARIGRWYARLRKNSDCLLHATNVADIYRAKEEKKLAVVFHFQNASPIGYDVGLVEVFQRLGVRIIQLTYNIKNPLGDGCTERTDAGLSDLGVAAVQEMNRVGIVVDLTHTGLRTTLDAMEVSRDPVVFSHSNARAVCDHPRNLTDEQIRMAARTGGVIGLNGFPAFVKRDTPRPTLDDLLDHLDYMVQLTGIDHVGLGLDYYITDLAGYQEQLSKNWKAESYPPPPYHYPQGIEDASKLSNVAHAMLRRGYKESDVRKVLGENFLRVYKHVWKV